MLDLLTSRLEAFEFPPNAMLGSLDDKFEGFAGANPLNSVPSLDP